jgi:hypothetical protein
MIDGNSAVGLALLVGMVGLFGGMWIENTAMNDWPFLGREDLIKCHKRLQQIVDDLRVENGELWRRNQKLAAENTGLRNKLRDAPERS